MDLKDSVVKGSVLISHQRDDGKHRYQVENVVKYKNENRGNRFARRGDELMQINGVSVQDLTPEQLAEGLAEGNPMLTLHEANRKKQHGEPSPPSDDFLSPVSKETTTLNFCMEMMREAELEVGPDGDGEDICRGQEEEEEEGGDLLVVTMSNTSISVVRGRGGCSSGGSCEGCRGGECTFSDVVMVSQSSTVTLVPRGSGNFRREKTVAASIEHVASHQYIRGLCSQKTLYTSPNPEKITIYYYKSSMVDQPHRGVPVVLNFTESDCFLRCCQRGESVQLQVEACDKQRLRQIARSDENTLSFVFYMKGDRSRQRTFESARFAGWFIRISTDTVDIQTVESQQSTHDFYFIIQMSPAAI